jgi:hypothetical protein
MPEAETWRYRGQTIDREQIAFLREFIRGHPDSSRWKLSRQLCEALDWKQANGALRDVVCRGLLLMLERAGEIELPPVRWRIVGQRRTARPRPEAVLIDTTPLTMPLGALGPIEIQLVRRTADEPLFHSLMEQFHYLRYEQPVGEHLKYLVWAQGRPVACLAWSSAPRHLASRDRFIGWSGEARRRNIRYLAYNTRFLLLPWISVPHLASHILGRMSRQISQDWQRVYGHPIYFWKPSLTRSGSAGHAIGRRTGWCWGEPRAEARTTRHIRQTDLSKKCLGYQSPAGFASYCSKSK